MALLVRPDLTYVVSYHTNVGHYSGDQYYFAGKGAGKNAVRALADGVVGGSGVYKYGSTTAFPTSTYRATNYYVDVAVQELTDGSGKWNNTTTGTDHHPGARPPAPRRPRPPRPRPRPPPPPRPPRRRSPRRRAAGVPCGLTAAAKSCWAVATPASPVGPRPQIVPASRRSCTRVGDLTITTARHGDRRTDGSTAASPSRPATSTIRNSLIRTTNPCFGGDGQARSVRGQHRATARVPAPDEPADHRHRDRRQTTPGYDYDRCRRANYTLLR